MQKGLRASPGTHVVDDAPLALGGRFVPGELSRRKDEASEPRRMAPTSWNKSTPTVGPPRKVCGGRRRSQDTKYVSYERPVQSLAPFPPPQRYHGRDKTGSDGDDEQPPPDLLDRGGPGKRRGGQQHMDKATVHPTYISTTSIHSTIKPDYPGVVPAGRLDPPEHRAGVRAARPGPHRRPLLQLHGLRVAGVRTGGRTVRRYDVCRVAFLHVFTHWRPLTFPSIPLPTQPFLQNPCTPPPLPLQKKNSWAGRDANIIALELITVFLLGPLCLWAAYAIVAHRPYRHLLQLVISTAELYGGWMTFCPDALDGSKSLALHDPVLLWVHLVFMNGLWVVVPALLLWESGAWVVHACALAKTEERKEKGRGVVEGLPGVGWFYGAAGVLGLYVVLVPLILLVTADPPPPSSS